jgi:hypothetical protein
MNQPKVSWQGQKQLFASRGGRGNVEDVDHGRVDHVYSIIKLEEAKVSRILIKKNLKATIVTMNAKINGTVNSRPL